MDIDHSLISFLSIPYDVKRQIDLICIYGVYFYIAYDVNHFNDIMRYMVIEVRPLFPKSREKVSKRERLDLKKIKNKQKEKIGERVRRGER